MGAERYVYNDATYVTTKCSRSIIPGMPLGYAMPGDNNLSVDNVTLLRSKIRLIDVVSEKVTLTKRGGNHYIGLCPFHGEKTPSFNVNCDNELFYCFGCGASGDVIQFISDTEGLDFKQAMAYLADKYGVELIVRRGDSRDHTKDFLLAIMEKATSWLSQQLHESKVALGYLKERGIDESTIKRFRLGYVPTSGIKSYLLSSGEGIEQIRETGLISKNDQDYLYNRIIFPICNFTGKVISFGGRSLSSGHLPKYLNSAENALFKKRESMYGLHLAMGHAKKLGKIIVVEGYMDVLILSQMGIPNVVGLLGTAMTEFHIESIWSVIPEIIVWMDGDQAGLKASVKIANLALSQIKTGKSIRFVSCSTGKDPHDACLENGIDYVKKQVEEARLLSEFIWEYEILNCGIGEKVKPEQCMILEGKIKEYISKIQDSHVVKYYKNFFYQQIKTLQSYRGNNADIYNRTRGRATARKDDTRHRLQNMSLEVCAEENYQIRVLYTVVSCPKLLDDRGVLEQFASIDFSDKEKKELQQHIVDIKSTSENILSKDDLVEQLKLRGRNLEKVVSSLIKSMTNVGCAFMTHGKNSQEVGKLAQLEWEKLMLSKQLSEIHDQIVKLRLEGRHDVAFSLSEHAREIDDRLRNLWRC